MITKIKTLAEYQQLASRTCPDLGSPEKNLMHMNLGIFTEAGEFLDPFKKELAYNKPLDLVNLGEELADICWYVANKARIFFPTNWEDISQQTIDIYQKEFDTTFVPLYSQYEKLHKILTLISHVICPAPEDYLIEETQESFEGIKDMIIIKYIAEDLGFDFYQLLTNNITKLMVRYPEKFTNEAAINRDLKAERAELEK